MTKKLRKYIIVKCIDVVKFLRINGFISKQTAINWIYNVTLLFGKRRSNGKRQNNNCGTT